MMRKLFGLFFGLSILILSNGCSDSSTKKTPQANGPLENYLRQWGTAVVLSDSSSVSGTIKYNTGATASSYTLNGVTYNIGPINLYNYVYSSQTGPTFLSNMVSSVFPAIGYIANIQNSDEYALEHSIPGNPEITKKNAEIRKTPLIAGTNVLKNTEPSILAATLGTGTTYPFYDYNGAAVSAYLLSTGTVTANSRTITVNVYVGTAETSIYGLSAVQAAANAALSNFIGDGGSDSIYGWVTSIYGAEWGTPKFKNLISDNNTISILMFDIDGDGTNGTNGSFTVGYFYPADNFVKSSYAYSNEKIMFSLDLPFMLKFTSSETSWTSTGSYPKKIYSTLAHEFQHMIHFYQKGVLQAVGTSLTEDSTWLDEMCSAVTEDFVANKLDVEGPRGVIDVNSTGSTLNTLGRLPLFNYANNDSLTTWDSALEDYSSVYAFGAYLSRNFGGPELFKNIVQTGNVDVDAINGALTTLSESVSVSADTGTTWTVSAADSVRYIGSSSLTITPQASGNTIYFIVSNTLDSSASAVISGGYSKTVTANATSNTYIKAGTINSATTYNFSLSSGVVITAVAR
jgi:hypothetical protein